MKKKQVRLRYDNNWEGHGEYYVLELRTDTKEEYGLCYASPVRDGEVSTQILLRIIQVINLGYIFEPYY